MTHNSHIPLTLAVSACLALGSSVIPSANAQTSEEGISTPLLFAPSGSDLNLASGDASNLLIFKNGPYGPILLIAGGSNADIEPRTDIQLLGGTWGSGALVNNVAPLFQNSVFTGSTAGGGAAFGAFLQQTDNSANTVNGTGLTENLILNGPDVQGWRGAGVFNLNINAPTGNTSSQDYTGLTGKCNMWFGDPVAAGSSCFGGNFVSAIGEGVTAAQNVGLEVDTWELSQAKVIDRIGEQIVDIQGSSYGTQASRDDVALSLNNQYGPSADLGFKTGLEFGRYGGAFPVATNGTLIYGQGNQGARFTVENGLDWHLGTFTGNAYNDGHVVITGNGLVGIGTQDPRAALHVYSGNSAIVADFQNPAGLCSIRVSASSFVPSCSSDIRLKRDIVDTGDALTYFDQMHIRDFTVKSTGERKTGVIAQEIQKAHPEMVHMGANDFYQVDAPDPWKLVKAIQELEAQNKELRAEFEAYKNAHP